MSVSYLVATIGRPTLDATLRSIVNQAFPDDEVLVIGATDAIKAKADEYGCRFIHCEPGNDWGATERNYATPFATGQYLAFLDDDDFALYGARAIMQETILTCPGRPIIFRMRYGTDGAVLWHERRLCLGNVGTPMFVLPNEPDKLGTWVGRYGGDFDFINTMKWSADAIVWMPQVIAQIRPQ